MWDFFGVLLQTNCHPYLSTWILCSTYSLSKCPFYKSSCSLYIVRVSKYSPFISPFPIIRLVSLYVILSPQSYPFNFLHCHPCGGYCFASMIQHIFADLYPLLLFVRPLLSEVALWEILLTNSFPPFFKKLFNIIRYGDTVLDFKCLLFFSNTVRV